MAWAGRYRGAPPHPRCLDIGCGAARNAVALSAAGYRVVGTDLSMPMLVGAQVRLEFTPLDVPVDLVLAPMAPLPFKDRQFDLVVAHGVWNLAHSGAEFRSAVAEAARVARPGAGLFLFTFSRRTLPPDATPDAGESFVFSSWNGEPQCFLTEAELDRRACRRGLRARFGRAAHRVQRAEARRDTARRRAAGHLRGDVRSPELSPEGPQRASSQAPSPWRPAPARMKRYAGVAQMVRARGSYPRSPGFKSLHRHHLLRGVERCRARPLVVFSPRVRCQWHHSRTA